MQGHTATEPGFKPRWSGLKVYAHDHCISAMKGHSLGRTEKAEAKPTALGRPKQAEPGHKAQKDSGIECTDTSEIRRCETKNQRVV